MKLISLTEFSTKTLLVINPEHIVSLRVNTHDAHGSCIISLVNRTEHTVIESTSSIQTRIETLNR